MFSFAEKADLAWKGLVSTGPCNPPIASQGGTHQGPSSETAQNVLLGAAFCKGKLYSGNKPQPQCVLAQDRSAYLVLTKPYAPHRAKEGLGCLWLYGHSCLAGGLCSLKPTPNVFSFRQEADLA